VSRSEERDAHWMGRALELARRGVALAHPNPMVGAVLVKNGRVVGEGFHAYDGRKHAEIIAIERAGRAARNATLYVNLEPCCTTGRTGPCTNAILAAGVKRVVAAMEDPNPAVAGRGFRQLRRAGAKVEAGVRRAEAQSLNEAFTRWIRTGRPLVTLKSAMTLDGRIASPVGSVTWITSVASRKEVQRLRHEADALLTGIGTVLTDDPRMTDRTGEPRRCPLLRVIVDSRLRLPLGSKIVKSARRDVLVFTTQPQNSPKARRLHRAGVEVIHLHARRGHVALDDVVRELGRRKILGVLLEAGGELNGAALEAGIVDKVILFYAPKILGSGGVPVARMRPRPLDKLPSLVNQTLLRFGPDFALIGYFRDVFALGGEATQRNQVAGERKDTL
jgi:diaminohydroxyphosphoribosylaminopyrimidine deaminase/5-amino-6-(5-phosphoribosylamino)uracil reductase